MAADPVLIRMKPSKPPVLWSCKRDVVLFGVRLHHLRVVWDKRRRWIGYTFDQGYQEPWVPPLVHTRYFICLFPCLTITWTTVNGGPASVDPIFTTPYEP